eukprot:TRINITY_DN4861_c0_g1_i1.p1 TRINITY_DN4861_c0_g1~~TRINITY_DN4861_c0_g1_i1.p1  ORF type:complete len:197 (-),score=35.91 TRINITY_DN4861_c0_g1_i1:57-566(-)
MANTNAVQGSASLEEMRGRMNKTASEAIFHSLKTTPTQTVVTIEEVIAVLQQVMSGIMKPQAVDDMVVKFANSRGLASELSSFNEKEFKDLMNRIISDIVDEWDANGDGAISKNEFYDNLAKVYGWQAWLAKRAIHKTFEKVLKESDNDGDGLLSKEVITLRLQFLNCQ